MIAWAIRSDFEQTVLILLDNRSSAALPLLEFLLNPFLIVSFDINQTFGLFFSLRLGERQVKHLSGLGVDFAVSEPPYTALFRLVEFTDQSRSDLFGLEVEKLVAVHGEPGQYPTINLAIALSKTVADGTGEHVIGDATSIGLSIVYAHFHGLIRLELFVDQF